MAEPIKDKGVKELPGIGPLAAERMKRYNLWKAEEVLGMFLQYKRDETIFCRWLMSVTGANSKDQKQCYDALQQFCDQHL